jgi:hypothetical protein
VLPIPPVPQSIQQPLAGDAISGPGVEVEPRLRPLLAVKIHEHDLLGQHLPMRLAALQVPVKPRLLRFAQHLGHRVRHTFAGRGPRIVAGLIRAVLASVQDVQVQQISPGRVPVELGRRSAREGRAAHRHMFVEGLHRRLLAQHEDFGRGSVLVQRLDPVVIELVIIPGAEPARRGVAGLEISIHLVLGVASPIVVKTVGFTTGVLTRILYRPARASVGAAAASLVNVVAVAVDEVQLLGGSLAVGCVEALLIGLAADHAEAGAANVRTGGRRGDGTPRRGALASG